MTPPPFAPGALCPSMPAQAALKDCSQSSPKTHVTSCPLNWEGESWSPAPHWQAGGTEEASMPTTRGNTHPAAKKAAVGVKGRGDREEVAATHMGTQDRPPRPTGRAPEEAQEPFLAATPKFIPPLPGRPVRGTRTPRPVLDPSQAADPEMLLPGKQGLTAHRGRTGTAHSWHGCQEPAGWEESRDTAGWFGGGVGGRSGGEEWVGGPNGEAL